MTRCIVSGKNKEGCFWIGVQGCLACVSSFVAVHFGLTACCGLALRDSEKRDSEKKLLSFLFIFYNKNSLFCIFFIKENKVGNNKENNKISRL
jgi:hypothetical protein